MGWLDYGHLGGGLARVLIDYYSVSTVIYREDIYIYIIYIYIYMEILFYSYV